MDYNFHKLGKLKIYKKVFSLFQNLKLIIWDLRWVRREKLL